MKFSYIKLGGGVCLLFSPLLAVAATGTGYPVGTAVLYPSLNLSMGQDANVTQASNDDGETATESGFINVSAGAELKKQTSTSTYAAGLTLDLSDFIDSSTDNYMDYNLKGSGTWQLTRKADAAANITYGRGHYARGTTDYGDNVSQVEKTDSVGIDGKFGYGQPSAKARIEVAAGHQTLRHRNDNLASTEDQDATRIGATFYYKIQPKTSLLLEARDQFLNYKSDAVDLDSEVRTFNAGATWYATAKTDGTVKLGYTTKDFDSPAYDDFSGMSWEVSGQWRPRTYSLFDISTARYTSNPTGFGNNVITRNLAVDWTYSWNQRLSHTLGFYAHQRDFEGGFVPRTDDKIDYNLSVKYLWRDWLSFKGGAKHSRRTSTVEGNDYSRTIFSFGVALVW